MSKIGGFSKEQYDAYLYVSADYQGIPGDSHWVAKFNVLPAVVTFCNRFVQLILTGEYLDNAALLTRRFREHKFSEIAAKDDKIAAQDELKAAWEIFKRFKECDNLIGVDEHIEALDKIEQDLQEAERLLNSPKIENVLPPKPPKKSAPVPKTNEVLEELPPVDPGKGKENQPVQIGDVPPPPPPPPPGVPLPPPPPPPGKGIHPGPYKLPAPVLPSRSFKGEPLPPTFESNPKSAVLEAMTKQQLENEIKVIDDYLSALKAVLDPIEAVIGQEAKCKKDYDEAQIELKNAKDELATQKALRAKLSRGKKEEAVGFNTDKAKIDLPLVSDEYLENLSDILLKNDWNGKIPRKFSMSDKVEYAEEKIEELEPKVGFLPGHIDKLKAELDVIRKTENNGISFDQLNQVLAEKNSASEPWKRASKSRQHQLDQLAKGPKTKKQAAVGKSNSFNDFLAAHPKIVQEHPVLAKMAQFEENHDAQILFKNPNPAAIIDRIVP